MELGHRVDKPLDLGVTIGGVTMQAASADLRHRQVGHINRRSTGVLRNVPGNGVDYTGEVEACGTRPLKGRGRTKINRKWRRTTTLYWLTS